MKLNIHDINISKWSNGHTRYVAKVNNIIQVNLETDDKEREPMNEEELIEYLMKRQKKLKASVKKALREQEMINAVKRAKNGDV